MDAQQKVEGQANKEDKKGILGKLQDITPDKDEPVSYTHLRAHET